MFVLYGIYIILSFDVLLGNSIKIHNYIVFCYMLKFIKNNL